MRLLAVALMVGLLSGPAAAAEPGRELRICYESQAEWSWIRPGQGTDSGYVLLELVRAKLGQRFEYVGLPWKRCLNDMQEGREASEWDGCDKNGLECQ